MHLLMILATISIAYWLRLSYSIPDGNWHLRWRKTLFSFLFPPLLIFTTFTAVVCMGSQGKMGGMYTGSFSYLIALVFLSYFNILALKQAFQGWKSVQSARECPQIYIGGRTARLLQTKALFAGQMGFWTPELVVSQGLLETLSPEHLKSVLSHEQGHYHYRDTFWFFWLGLMRSCTSWLPNTEALWQELLILRELRADSYAASQVDPLTLAESLLLVSNQQPFGSEVCCAALSSPGTNRLEQRIDALLNTPEPTSEIPIKSFYIFFLAFLPLLTVVFHT
ncbi:MAG: M56 family metallopeptidase [Sphaerospermopsis sp. SIO1G2]|nr:M56 family metallopeptidase [Sphaerospermopsis sp. SIO1G1]NET70715.1 M56 family metallopeptidase [Sphaerospermopsis sp. SIO1G2]